jgi:hypothetical protein
MSYNPLDPSGDPFGPPEVSCEVECLHCGQQYESYLIEWRVLTNADGQQHGFWCCPTPGCDGMGFGFDILPTDHNYRDERGGWVCDDEDDYDFDEADFIEGSSSDGPSSQPKPSGNGNGRPKFVDPQDDDIPF